MQHIIPRIKKKYTSQIFKKFYNTKPTLKNSVKFGYFDRELQ